MMQTRLLDVIALLDDVPGQGLRRGQFGTIVEELAPGIYEVEFSDDDGRTVAMIALRAEQIEVLR